MYSTLVGILQLVGVGGCYQQLKYLKQVTTIKKLKLFIDGYMIKKIITYRNWNGTYYIYDMSHFIFAFKENRPNWKIKVWLYDE